MNVKDLLTLYDKEQRIDSMPPDLQKSTSAGVVRFVRPAPGMNYVAYSCVDSADLGAVIQEQIAFFSRMDQPFSWNVCAHDTPPDLKDHLLRHGFGPDDDPDAVMVLDVHDAAPDLLQPVDDRVRHIIERDQLDDITSIEAQVWGGDFAWLKERLGTHLELHDYVSIYVADQDGQPACSGWMYFQPNSQFANLFGGATIPRYRQLGLYSAILAVRVQEAIARGYRFLVTGASPMSQPILAKHGFHLLTHAYAYEWQGVPR